MFGKGNGQTNYSEPSVKLKLLGLQYMKETCPELECQNFKSVRSLIYAINLNRNQISPLAMTVDENEMKWYIKTGLHCRHGNILSNPIYNVWPINKYIINVIGGY